MTVKAKHPTLEKPREPAEPKKRVSLKALLAAAPLEDVDLKRSFDPGREVQFE